MFEPCRDGKLTLLNRPQPLEAAESIKLADRVSVEC